MDYADRYRLVIATPNSPRGISRVCWRAMTSSYSQVETR
jgi:hypothetical protein